MWVVTSEKYIDIVREQLPEIPESNILAEPCARRERINDFDFVQLKNGNGYDHNWVLNAKGDINRRAASLKSQKTGIVLDVYTRDRNGFHYHRKEV